MQTHQDIWWSVSDQDEHAYFRPFNVPTPILEFTPWPIKVQAIIFPDGSSFVSAGGGGVGAGQTPWNQPINGNGFSLSNVNNISANNISANNIDASSLTVNGVPVGGQSPWLSDIDAGGFNLTNASQIISTGYLTLTGYNMNFNTTHAFQFNSTQSNVLNNAFLFIVNAGTAMSIKPDGTISMAGSLSINGQPVTATIVAATAPPTSLGNGTLWFDQGSLSLNVLYNGSWVQI